MENTPSPLVLDVRVEIKFRNSFLVKWEKIVTSRIVSITIPYAGAVVNHIPRQSKVLGRGFTLTLEGHGFVTHEDALDFGYEPEELTPVEGVAKQGVSN